MMLTAASCNVNKQLIPIIVLEYVKIIPVSANVLMHQPRAALYLIPHLPKKKEASWNFLTHKAKFLFIDFCLLANGKTRPARVSGSTSSSLMQLTRLIEIQICVGATLIYTTGPLSVLHADDFNFPIQAQDKGGFG